MYISPKSLELYFTMCVLYYRCCRCQLNVFKKRLETKTVISCYVFVFTKALNIA